MNIAVLLKQVPAVSDIQLAADNNLVRVGAPSMLNPVDLHALEAALALKDQEGGTVTLVTMGTALASDILREGIAMGADKGILLSDERMAGSDTLATGRILAAALGTRRLKLRDPGKPQLCLEMAVEFLNGFTKNNMGAHGPDFAPYLGTIALYILLCNIIGIFGLVPPTKDLNVTAALAIMSAVLIYGAQFRYHGLRGG